MTCAGHVVLFQMGEFYEMFFEDAEIASRTLGLTLTRRGRYSGKPIPMAGIPLHSKDTHVGRLVRAGYPVVICDQMEVCLVRFMVATATPLTIHEWC